MMQQLDSDSNDKIESRAHCIKNNGPFAELEVDE